MPAPPSDVAGLLAALRADDPGRPRVTWYGPDAGEGAGERIELSARVLSTWVAKTVGLLQDEVDAGPGTTVRLDAPGHWKSLVWVLAAWAVGAEVVGPATDAELVVTTDPATAGAADVVVVLALPSLARSFGGPLPPGAVDYAAVVTGFPDDLPPGLPGGTLPAHEPAAPGGRVLLETAGRDPHDLAVAALGPLAAAGSLVLAARALSDAERASERVTG